MKTLVVEDDISCSVLLKKILAPYGECDVTENGIKGLEAFDSACEKNEPFDLICLDIMMPEMDGQEVLKEIRKREEKTKKRCSDGVKIIMVTALGDNKNIMQSFKAQCEAYIVKPIDKNKLLNEIRLLGLI